MPLCWILSDDLELLEGINLGMKMNGVHSVALMNADAAFARLDKKERPMTLIMDVHLKNRDEIITAVRELPEFETIKIAWLADEPDGQSLVLEPGDTIQKAMRFDKFLLYLSDNVAESMHNGAAHAFKTPAEKTWSFTTRNLFSDFWCRLRSHLTASF